MTTKFSQFNIGGAQIAGDYIAGLRNGVNTLFNPSGAVPVIEQWNTIVAPQPLLANQGYIITTAGPGNYPLPVVAAFGSILQIIIDSISICTITQAAGQQINMGNVFTTVGIAGSLSNTQIGDSLTLVCTHANTTFFVLGAPQGIWQVI